MLSQPASGLVGLIVIESPGEHDDATTGGIGHDDATTGGIGHDDATLGQILRWLACGREFQGASTPETAASVVSEKPPRLSVRRLFRRPLGPEWPGRVAADCRGLGVQLERAAGQLRRQIATAGSDAR